MDLIYGLPLIAVLTLAWLAARHVIQQGTATADLLRRQKQRSRGRRHDAPETVTSRSDMRSTDAPVTVGRPYSQRSRAPRDGSDHKPPRRRA